MENHAKKVCASNFGEQCHSEYINSLFRGNMQLHNLTRYLVIIFCCFCYNYIEAEAKESKSIFDFLFGKNKKQDEVDTSPQNLLPPGYDNGDTYSILTDGSFRSSAKLRILNINTGKSQYHTVGMSDVKKLDSFSIHVLSCWQEEKVKIHPESMSLVALYKNQDIDGEDVYIDDEQSSIQDLIFYGWIFGNHKSIAQPRYKNYYIQLDKCE